MPTTIEKARRHERAIANAFREAVASARSGNPVDTAFLRFKAAISETFIDVARNKARRMRVAFDPLDAELVRVADQQGQQRMRALIADFRANPTGLNARQEIALRNYERALRNPNRGLLDRQLRDRRFDASIERAIREDDRLSEQKIERAVLRYRQRLLAHRARVIGQTEATRAENAAAFVLGRKAVEQGRSVRRFWDHRDDSRVRNAHRDIVAMNPDGVGPDEPFQTPLGPLMYPGDPNGVADNIVGCRCQVRVEVS